MTRNLFIIPALLAGLAIAQSAHAAPGPNLPVVGAPTSISAGIFVPSDGSDKRAGGSSQLDVEFRYGLPIPNPIPVTRTVIGLGIETGAKSGKHSTVVPITATQDFSLTGGSLNAPDTVYGGVGAGAYIQNLSGISSAVRIGLHGELGVNVTSNLFVNARYQFVTHSNGLAVTAGLRF